MTTHANPRTVDVHALPVMLTGLRLPSFHRHWPALAERADKKGFWSRSRNAIIRSSGSNEGGRRPEAGPPRASWRRWPSSNSPSAKPDASVAI